MTNMTFYHNLVKELDKHGVKLVAVSKTRTVEEIMALYNEGHRIFGENRVQELLAKKPLLPADIEWHLIGTLQSNKVKQIIQHVSLIHSGSSLALLEEIDKRSAQAGMRTNVLLQIHIAQEDTKSGFTKEELLQHLDAGAFGSFCNINFCGLMGMATFTEHRDQIRTEFSDLKELFDMLHNKYFTGEEFSILSMGMSGDYPIAIEAGANMVRIGSLLFGKRH